MTRRQRDLLAFIRSYKAEHDGMATRIVEMRDGIGINSASSICSLLDALEGDGRIVRERSPVGRARRRGLTVIETRTDLSRVPTEELVGRLNMLVAECRRRGLEVAI